MIRNCQAVLVLSLGVFAGCGYALPAAFVTNRLTRERMPEVRVWGSAVQLTPTNLGLRLPSDSVQWDTYDGSTVGGQAITVIRGVADDGSVADVFFLWGNDGDCGKWNHDMFELAKLRMHAEALGLTSSADSLPEVIEAGWKPAEHSGWKTGYLLRDEGLACFDGGTRSLIVHVKRGYLTTASSRAWDLHGISRSVRTLLWVVGTAARDQRTSR